MSLFTFIPGESGNLPEWLPARPFPTPRPALPGQSYKNPAQRSHELVLCSLSGGTAATSVRPSAPAGLVLCSSPCGGGKPALLIQGAFPTHLVCATITVWDRDECPFLPSGQMGTASGSPRRLVWLPRTPLLHLLWLASRPPVKQLSGSRKARKPSSAPETTSQERRRPRH